MRCGGIVVITVKEVAKSTGQQELDDCVKALRLKYATTASYASDVIMDTQMTEGVFSLSHLPEVEKNLDSLQKLSKDWLDDVTRTQPGVGLYLQCHGGQTDMSPGANVFVKCLAKLYEQGLAFRKINLAACYSAGKEQILIENAALGKFCQALETSKIPTTSLDKMCVAAYRAFVTFDSRGFNTFTEESKAAQRTHPDPKTLSKHTILQARAISDADVATKSAAPQKNLAARMTAMQKAAQTFDEQAKQDTLSLQRYILNKRARRFDAISRTWQPISLMEYTDNPDTRKMILVGEHIAAAAQPSKFKLGGQPQPVTIPVTL